MNTTFDGHTPNENSLLDLDHSDTHIHNIDAKRYKIVMIVPHTCGTPFESYWYKTHEEAPC